MRTPIRPDAPIEVLGRDDAGAAPARWPPIAATVVVVAVALLVFGLWPGGRSADPAVTGAPEDLLPVETEPTDPAPRLDVATWFGEDVFVRSAGEVVWAVEPDTGRTARYEDGAWLVGPALPDDPPRFLTSASISWVDVDPTGRMWMAGYAAVDVTARLRRYEPSVWYADGDRWRLLPEFVDSGGWGPYPLVANDVAFGPDGVVYLVTEDGGDVLAWDGATYRRIVTPVSDIPVESGSSERTVVHATAAGIAVAGDGSVWMSGSFVSGWYGTPFFASYEPATRTWTEDVPWVGEASVGWMVTAPTGELWIGFEDVDAWDEGWAVARRSPDTGAWTVFEQSGPGLWMQRMLAADRSSVYVTGWDDRGVVRIDAQGWTAHLGDRRISTLAIASDGTRWAVFEGRAGVHQVVFPQESG